MSMKLKHFTGLMEKPRRTEEHETGPEELIREVNSATISLDIELEKEESTVHVVQIHAAAA